MEYLRDMKENSKSKCNDYFSLDNEADWSHSEPIRTIYWSSI